MCSVIVNVTEGKVCKYLIKPLLFTFVPWCLFELSPNSSIEKGLRSLSETLTDFILSNHLAIIFFTVLVVWFLQWLNEAIRSNSFPSKWSYRQLISALKILDIAVDVKEDRIDNGFDSYARDGTVDSLINTSVPEQQIHILTRAINTFFEQYVHDEIASSIVVTTDLIRVEDDTPCGWESSSRNVGIKKTTIFDLQQPTSTAMTAIRDGQCTVVASTKKELAKGTQARFYSVDENKGNASILCYPITDRVGGKIIYILSISASKKNTFVPESVMLYKYMLDRFAIRLRLEYKLLQIREITNHSE